MYIQPERELTEEEKLLADVIALNDRIPCGGQMALARNLDRAIAGVANLFGGHNLPLREELLGELRLWREHTEHGLKLSEQCDELMLQVIRKVDGACKRI